MFIKAIETASEYTRAINTICRKYGSADIHRSASALFFVNSDGWALTCKHVADLFTYSEHILEVRQAFIRELNTGSYTAEDKVALERKYKFSNETTFELRNRFVNCVEGSQDVDIISHPILDIALVHFSKNVRLLCDSFPKFASNGADLKPGKYLCRLGFPFASFSNCKYDTVADEIHWTNEGRVDTPVFPSDGMVTRLFEWNNHVAYIEISTPGLRGQSGGPAFDTNGVIWGIQSKTTPYDLDFQEDPYIETREKTMSGGMLYLGKCIHVDILKSFMQENDVKFEVA